MRAGLELEPVADGEARFHFDTADLRLTAVTEEEVVALPESFDEIEDPVPIDIEPDRHGIRTEPQGEIKLEAGLGIEVGVSGDEAAARLATVVAV